MLFVALSVGVFLTLSVVPHHHHDGVACVLTSEFLAEGYCSACGGESEHDSSGSCSSSCSDESGSDNRCVEDLDFFTPRLDNIKHSSECDQCDISSAHHLAAHFATFISSSSFVFVDEPLPLLGLYGGPTLSLYHLTQLDSICGLRAPPLLVS